jgi:hypothetical protein
VSGHVRGIVINLNAFGATIRLEDGEIASVPAYDVNIHRADYDRAMRARRVLAFERHDGRRVTVTLAPQIHDAGLEEQITGYLKMTEEWDVRDGVLAHERHFLKKKRRAALFESRHSNDR